jgi:inner membrane protein
LATLSGRLDSASSSAQETAHRGGVVKNHPLLAKTLTLVLIGFLLWLPLTMVSNKINERSALQRQVERDVEATAFGPQRLIGPFIVLECVEDYMQELVAPGSRGDVIGHERRSRPCPARYVFPDSLAIEGDVPTEIRSRGIHPVRVFQSALAVRGTVRLPREPEPVPNATRRWTSAALAFVVSDLRGLKNVPALVFDQRSIPFQPGTRLFETAQTLLAPLELSALGVDTEHAFSFSVQVHGTSRLAIAPMAMTFVLDLQSTWPHPSFDGAFLPDARTVSDSGFRATWNINQFAAGGSSTWSEALRSGKLDAVRMLGVSFVDPIDVYARTYRAAEYGILLIGLTFALFLLFEAVRHWRVHAVQYGLVGSALAIFFLLLLALAEHIGFAAAYVVASAACIGLLTFYLTYVAGSLRRGIGFAGYFVTLYGALYVMLSSEDYALLLGSVLAFAALTAVMAATRRIDWFAWSRSIKAAQGER